MVGDDADLREVYDTERQLLYVACTRARDDLLVRPRNFPVCGVVARGRSTTHARNVGARRRFRRRALRVAVRGIWIGTVGWA